MSRFHGKVAVITGGSSGIGLATARRLRDEGAKTFITGRRLHDSAAAVDASGGGLEFLQADVTKLEEIEDFFRRVEQTSGKIDILFINAGVGRYATIADTTELLFDEIFATNTKGAFFTLQKALPCLNRGAAVVFNAIAQPAPVWRRGGSSAYTASKAALKSIAQAAAVELADRGVRVNIVSPGITRTAIFERAAEAAGMPLDAVNDRLDRAATELPLQRLAEPAEIASVVAFLASEDASYITGREIQVDGGSS